MTYGFITASCPLLLFDPLCSGQPGVSPPSKVRVPDVGHTAGHRKAQRARKRHFG